MCFLKKRPIHDLTKEDAIWWIEYDIELHQEWLNKPEGEHTGSWGYHRQWIADFQEVLKQLKGEPSSMTREEIIVLLTNAKATHTIDAQRYPIGSYEYKWNYDWWYVYDSIIDLLEVKA
jgi:hypothetical protein